MEGKQYSSKRLTVTPSSYAYFIVTSESPELIDNDSNFPFTLITNSTEYDRLNTSDYRALTVAHDKTTSWLLRPFFVTTLSL